MKIYTKGGDLGQTSLLGGTRLSKDEIRIEAYGTIDELNCCLGRLICHDILSDKTDELRHIQSRLFDLGSNLAKAPELQFELPTIEDSHVQSLEKSIDSMMESLPKLRHFVLPGSSIVNADAHICRAVCRRAERRLVTLSKEAEIDVIWIQFLNRLSDYLFALSRWISNAEGKDEILWLPNNKK